MKLTSLLQLVDKLQQAGKVDKLQRLWRFLSIGLFQNSENKLTVAVRSFDYFCYLKVNRSHCESFDHDDCQTSFSWAEREEHVINETPWYNSDKFSWDSVLTIVLTLIFLAWQMNKTYLAKTAAPSHHL